MTGTKRLLRKVLRCTMAPVRRHRVRRVGTVDASGRHMVPNDRFLPFVGEVLSEGHTAVIWVRGYSMRPFLEHERDRVKLACPQRVEVGDAVLARLAQGQYVLHRVIRRDGDRLILQGDGNLRGVEHCRMDDVCGVVIEYIHPGRTIPASDAGLRRRIRLWRVLRPVRRLMLTFYRAMLP